MSFVDRLRAELICVAPPWRTFEETIAGLAATLGRARLLPAGREAAAADAVRAREAEASTALLDIRAGVPHARLAGLDEPIVASRSRRPASTSRPDRRDPDRRPRPLAPDASDHHLQLLSSIATLLRSAELRTQLLTSPTPKPPWPI
jgi:mannitol/fructose-specific phosphotransferase system IIA component (Ntr-type)